MNQLIMITVDCISEPGRVIESMWENNSIEKPHLAVEYTFYALSIISKLSSTVFVVCIVYTDFS